MNTTITAAFVQQFHDSFVAANEQKESRFESKIVNRGSIVGSSFTANDMGTIEMSQVTNRYGDTEFTIPDVGTRQALMSDYDVAVPVDAFDLPKLLANPQGDYLQRAIAAAQRKKDAVIYAALKGSALRKTDESGSFAATADPGEEAVPRQRSRRAQRRRALHGLRLRHAGGHPGRHHAHERGPHGRQDAAGG
jgi:hypothetical protein